MSIKQAIFHLFVCNQFKKEKRLETKKPEKGGEVGSSRKGPSQVMQKYEARKEIDGWRRKLELWKKQMKKLFLINAIITIHSAKQSKKLQL